MEEILLACSPLLVNLLTQGIKKLQVIQFSQQKKTVIRFIATLLSFTAVVLGSTIDGVTVDQTTVVTFAETVFVFLGSQITYFYFKGK